MRIQKILYGGHLMNIRMITILQHRKTWKAVKDIAIKELSDKKLYVVDAFCGANKDTSYGYPFHR